LAGIDRTTTKELKGTIKAFSWQNPHSWMEVEVVGDYDLTFVGILNDDTTDVGRVHLGAVYVLDAHDGNVIVRETEKMSGRWVARNDLAEHRDAMETWSQIVYDAFVV